jgi:hypothetical protein
MATEQEDRPPRRLPRGWLELASLLHAPVFAWAAAVLPWKSWTFFSIVTALLAGLHLATAVLAALPPSLAWRDRALTLVWRSQAVASIAWLAYVGWGVLSSAWYVRSLYTGLGQGVAAALFAVFGLLVLVTVPISLWALGATGGLRIGRGGAAVALLVVGVAGGTLYRIADRADGQVMLGDGDVAATKAAVDAAIDPNTLPRVKGRHASLFTTEPVRCERPPNHAPVTLVATYSVEVERPAKGKKKTKKVAVPESRCLQGETRDVVVRELAALLDERGRWGPIKLDLIQAAAWLPPDDEPVTALSVRPGLDGLCGTPLDHAGTFCLMPWQLVAMSAFVTHAPIPRVPEARLGFSVDLARRRLETPDSPLFRIATTSWLVDPILGAVDVGRDQLPDAEVTAETVAAATRAAEQYILLAQRKDGRFNYRVDPFTGDVTMGRFSVARQAGTTMALCELAEKTKTVRRVVKRSLAMLATLEQRVPGTEMSVLRTAPDAKGDVERYGPTALSLAAMMRCRPYVGDRYDALAGRLGRGILALQRPDGSFHHRLNLTTGEPHPRTGGIYVDGQLILALVLLEARAAAGEPILPRDELAEPIERAMTFFSRDYWDIFLGDFLFIEENWHCIAAEAALGHHRHDAYERFCLDYVTMKLRTQLDEASGVHPDFIGGYGFGNVVPPHNTGTAGLGEAMAAALKVAKARDDDTTELERHLRAAMTYLLRNQWQPRRCFHCTKRRHVVGGFSEHMASPQIRIDYVQHAWAALGHGAEALGLVAEDGGA